VKPQSGPLLTGARALVVAGDQTSSAWQAVQRPAELVCTSQCTWACVGKPPRRALKSRSLAEISPQRATFDTGGAALSSLQGAF
jgi:hypothetical protein